MREITYETVNEFVIALTEYLNQKLYLKESKSFFTTNKDIIDTVYFLIDLVSAKKTARSFTSKQLTILNQGILGNIVNTHIRIMELKNLQDILFCQQHFFDAITPSNYLDGQKYNVPLTEDNVKTGRYKNLSSLGEVYRFDPDTHKIIGVGTYTIIPPQTSEYQGFLKDDPQFLDRISETDSHSCGGVNRTLRVKINHRWYFYKKVAHSDNLNHVKLWNRIYKDTGYDVAFMKNFSAYYPAIPMTRRYYTPLRNIGIVSTDFTPPQRTLETEIFRAGNIWFEQTFGLFQDDFALSTGYMLNPANFPFVLDHVNKTIMYYPLDMESISIAPVILKSRGSRGGWNR